MPQTVGSGEGNARPRWDSQAPRGHGVRYETDGQAGHRARDRDGSDDDADDGPSSSAVTGMDARYAKDDREQSADEPRHGRHRNETVKGDRVTAPDVEREPVSSVQLSR